MTLFLKKCHDSLIGNFANVLVIVQINAAEFSCPYWFSPGAKSIIHKILDPNHRTVSILFQLFQFEVGDCIQLQYYLLCTSMECIKFQGPKRLLDHFSQQLAVTKLVNLLILRYSVQITLP